MDRMSALSCWSNVNWKGPKHGRSKIIPITFALIQAALAVGQNTPAANPPQWQGCADPAPLFSISDYNGPMNKLVASIARKVELKAVHNAPRPSASTVCSLKAH